METGKGGKGDGEKEEEEPPWVGEKITRTDIHTDPDGGGDHIVVDTH